MQNKRSSRHVRRSVLLLWLGVIVVSEWGVSSNDARAKSTDGDQAFDVKTLVGNWKVSKFRVYGSGTAKDLPENLSCIVVFSDKGRMTVELEGITMFECEVVYTSKTKLIWIDLSPTFIFGEKPKDTKRQAMQGILSIEGDILHIHSAYEKRPSDFQPRGDLPSMLIECRRGKEK